MVRKNIKNYFLQTKSSFFLKPIGILYTFMANIVSVEQIFNYFCTLKTYKAYEKSF